MKKIVSILILSSILIGCKNTYKPNQTSIAKKFSPCDLNGEFMVIDDSKLEDSTRWKIDNEAFICNYSKVFDSCSKNQTVINLSMIKKVEDRAKWLTENCKYICFNDSYAFIEKVHFLPLTANQIRVLDSIPAKISKQDLDDKIKFVNDTNTKDDYDKWISFEIDSTKRVTIKENIKFDEKGRYFSIPLLKYILRDLKMTDFITFYEYNNGVTNIFMLNTDNKTYYFYNYSIKPQILKYLSFLNK